MKKIFAVCIIAIFLVTSFGFISAADSNSISVKVAGDLPNQITVNLLCDGKIVDNATLSSANSWKTTFKVSEEGNYDIKINDVSDYSVSVSGNEHSGFVISSKLLKDEVLGAAGDESLDDNIDSVENNDSNDSLMAANDENASNGNLIAANATNGTLTANNTGGNSSNETNSTDNSTDDNATSNGNSNDNNKTTSKKTVTKKTVTKKTVTKKVKQKPVKKPKNATAKTNNKTGFPIAVLVVAVMVAIFVPFSRKK